MSRSTSVRNILLDLDGTLTDNFAGISRCIVHALARLGAPAPDDATLRSCVGPPLRVSFARLLQTQDRDVVETALAHYRERYREVGWSENLVYDGIADAIAALAQRHRLFLCTSKPQPFAQRIVERFGFAPYLAGLYGADLAGTLDDKRVLLEHLVVQERLVRAECAMVGDRRHDMIAARTHGVFAVGVLWGYGSEAELLEAGAQRLLGDPGEMIAAFAEGT